MCKIFPYYSGFLIIVAVKTVDFMMFIFHKCAPVRLVSYHFHIQKYGMDCAIVGLYYISPGFLNVLDFVVKIGE